MDKDRVTVFSSRIEKWKLRPGDHIYAWRGSAACVVSHHGIYDSDKKVIHFAAPLEEPSAAAGVVKAAAQAAVITAVSEVSLLSAGRLLGRVIKANGYAYCWECQEAMRLGGVVSCCLDCFLGGDNLCLFAYSVPFWFYAATSTQTVVNRALQTCVGADADPPERVLKRANDLLASNGFGSYDGLANNSFDFAFYCKTGREFISPGKALARARKEDKCMIM